ncbi:autotransporter-associated beta strand repeat-containing protein, partial [Mesorhizobium sp. B1-1-5]|uniref:autotransporter-associated beta strand repeat-containing protein n=1 Tax=Mesorhizobium sp. B1-1-5 TaxID=2589979 RepID=UPI00117569DC
FTTDASLGAAGIGINLNNGTIGSVATVHPGPTSNRPVTITDKGGFSVASAPLTWSGVIGGSGQLTKSGDGDLSLSAANTYGGGTTVTGGVLRFTNDVNLGAAGTAITLNGGAVGTTKDTPAATSIDRKIVLAGNGGIDVALHPFIWSGSISGGGRLIKSGDGEFELTGTNTYAAGTRVEEGVLRIASDAKLGAAGTHLNLDGGGGLSASATFASTRPVWLTGARGIVLVDAGETLTLSGVVSESGALVKSGPGDLILSGANTYSGGTTVTGGVLRFANDGNLGAAATGIMLNGGAVGTMTDTPAATSISRNITLASNGGGIDVAAQSQSLSWSGNISGNGGLFKIGAGTLVLTGNNTYAGGTQVAGGTLWVASDA